MTGPKELAHLVTRPLRVRRKRARTSKTAAQSLDPPPPRNAPQRRKIFGPANVPAHLQRPGSAQSQRNGPRRIALHPGRSGRDRNQREADPGQEGGLSAASRGQGDEGPAVGGEQDPDRETESDLAPAGGRVPGLGGRGRAEAGDHAPAQETDGGLAHRDAQGREGVSLGPSRSGGPGPNKSLGPAHAVNRAPSPGESLGVGPGKDPEDPAPVNGPSRAMAAKSPRLSERKSSKQRNARGRARATQRNHQRQRLQSRRRRR